MANSPAVSNIDLFADEILVDPYPTYKALRDTAAIVHLPANDVYALTRYSAIRGAMGDSSTFSSVKAIGFNPAVNEALQGTSLASDPPAHTPLRATLAANLTPRKLRSIEEQINGKVEALVRKLAASGSFEAIDELATVECRDRADSHATDEPQESRTGGQTETHRQRLPDQGQHRLVEPE